MKKYICPRLEIKPALFQYFMAGSAPDPMGRQIGDGEATNSGVFEEDDADPTKGKGFWDDDN